jgi:ABC-type glycerol-3-phosphate transport system permease component
MRQARPAARVRARRRARTPRQWLGRVALYLALSLGALAAAFPFFWMLLTSLKTRGEATRIPPTLFPADPQWRNYIEAWNAAPFGRYFLNTTIMCIGIVAGALLTTVLAAYAFARLEFRGKNLLFTLFLSTMMIPFEATLIPNYIIVNSLPGIDFTAGGLRLTDTWYNTYLALIVPWTANVFSIFLLRQFFTSIPQDLYDAAALDGCGHARTLWSVALPLARAPLAAIVIFNFLWSWNSLLWPLIVTGRENMRPLQLGLSVFVNTDANEPQLLMAASAFTILPIVVLYFLAQRQFIEGIASSGLKG